MGSVLPVNADKGITDDPYRDSRPRYGTRTPAIGPRPTVSVTMSTSSRMERSGPST